MSELYDRIQHAKQFIEDRIKPFKPEYGVILGTGLGSLADEVEVLHSIAYDEIPDFPKSTLAEHEGTLLFGTIDGVPVAAMKGRMHCYEGYTARQVTFPLRVMIALGIRALMVSNAAGGMNRGYRRGDVMIIEDQINFMGVNPLVGDNDERLGPRFPDMSEPYSRKLIALAEEIATQNRIPARKGVYIGVMGPNLETAAEYRFFQIIGADAVGMSTVPEVIVAAHAGLPVFGLSCITDMCIPDTLESASIEAILEAASEAEPKITLIFRRALKKMREEGV